jgi:hypothetical protein
VLDHHGWGDAQPELNRLSKAGKWVEMADVIDDEMLSHFAVVAEPGDIAPQLAGRFGGLVDRVHFSADIDDPDTWVPVVEAIRAV